MKRSRAFALTAAALVATAVLLALLLPDAQAAPLRPPAPRWAPTAFRPPTGRPESVLRLLPAPRTAPWTPPATRPAAPAPVADTSGPCTPAVNALVHQAWGGLAGWAFGIIWRESRCQPGAWNPVSVGGSHATSLFQLLLPLLAGQYRAVGCNPATQAFDPSCNIRAARHLYADDGAAPWRL